MNLQDLDPATLMPSAVRDALIAREWMGWTRAANTRDMEPGEFVAENGNVWMWVADGLVTWSPSTNPTHAGEARRKAFSWGLHTDLAEEGSIDAITCWLGDVYGLCRVSETDGNVGKAEALATCRAIVAVLQARKAVSKETP
jgi:hypothetical protein